MNLADLTGTLRKFAVDRDWEQFHTPKNLAMALAAESGELLEVFQWLSPSESNNLSARQAEMTADELADILIYAIRLADVTGIDLEAAITSKIRRNDERYPTDLVKGSALKFSEREAEDA